MKIHRPIFVASSLATSLLLLLLPSVSSLQILQNARIYTVNTTNPWAEAIAIDDAGMIVAVGSNAHVNAAFPSPNNKVVDMGGRLVLPGFQDAHLHAVEAGINADICFVEANAPINDIPFYFDDCPNGGLFGDQGWIVGAGIDIGSINEVLASDPNAPYPITVLDREFPNTPVFILDQFGHGALANTRAMMAVGYDTLTTNPPGGRIDRDNTTGELTGLVLENAQHRFRDAAFPPTLANQQQAYNSLLSALNTLKANGITSVSDAGGFWRQAQTAAWGQVEDNGLMTVRASNALYVYPDTPIEAILPDLLSRYSNDPTRLVRFNQAKIYVDGILTLATGALYQPYESALDLVPGSERGLEYFGNGTTLNRVSNILVNNGFKLHFHVTGDRGAGLALDSIAQLSSNATGPHRLTHCFLVDARDRPRFAALGAVADFQLSPSSVATTFGNFLTDFLGPTRVAQLLPAVEIFNTGAKLTLSSDWDADTLSPLVKIKTVLTRPSGTSFPDVATVIPLLTKNPAELLGTNTGTLDVGKMADLIALDRNIFDMPVDTIDQAQVIFTMLGGRVIFDPQGIAGTPVTIPPTPAPTPLPDSAANTFALAGRALLVTTFCVMFVPMLW